MRILTCGALSIRVEECNWEDPHAYALACALARRMAVRMARRERAWRMARWHAFMDGLA